MTTQLGQSFQHQLHPGFLLEPLDWMKHQLPLHDANAIRSVLTLTPKDMHRIAFSITMNDEVVSGEMVLDLICGRAPQTISIPGLNRALTILPRRVLPQHSYRQLFGLLQDTSTRRWLFHCKTLTEEKIAGFHQLPSSLRKPAMLRLFDEISKMEHFMEGLKLISKMQQKPLEALIKELAKHEQTDQLIAAICKIIDQIPLTESLPPKNIGPFRRVDDPTAIKKLSRNWANCLPVFLIHINDGTYSVYLSDQEEPKAVALLVRQGRIGWLIEQIRGPRNIEYQPATERELSAHFQSEGITYAERFAAFREIVIQRF